MTRKITVSLDDEVADATQRLVDSGLAPSFSAAVSQALTAKLDAQNRARTRIREELDAARARDPEGFAAARERADAARAELTARDPSSARTKRYPKLPPKVTPRTVDPAERGER